MHSIQVYICKDEIKDHGIDFDQLWHKNVGQNFIMFPDTENLSKILNGKHLNQVFQKVAYCTTDYFGGIGEQTGECWINGEYKVCDSINEALKNIGVIRKEDMDEFDTIGLGRHRDMTDFEILFP